MPLASHAAIRCAESPAHANQLRFAAYSANKPTIGLELPLALAEGHGTASCTLTNAK
jgi:hypothetical protein